MQGFIQYVRTSLPAIITGISITFLIILVMIFDPAPLKQFERNLLDMRFSLRGTIKDSKQVAIITIDEKSLNTLGAWPWPRHLHANLIDILNKSGAKTIAFDIYFQQPTKDILTTADIEFMTAIKKAQNVILPTYFDFAPSKKPSHKAIISRVPEYPVEIVYPELLNEYPMVKGKNFFSSFSKLNQAALGLGHINMITDDDGILRNELLIVQYEDRYMPSLALRTAQAYLDVDRIQLIGGRGIQVGDTLIPISPVEINHAMLWGLIPINYRGGYNTFDLISFVDVLHHRFPFGAFRDKVVIIGATAGGLYDMRATPFTTVFPGVEKHATVIDNILCHDYITKPFQSDVLSAFLCILIGLIISFSAPAMRLPYAVVTFSALVCTIIIIAYAGFIRTYLWINITYPLLTASLVFISSILMQFSTAKQRAYVSNLESYDAIKRLGLAYQEKGSLELAYHTFNRLPLNTEVMTLLYHLALQLEKIRKEAIARQIYQRLYEKNPKFEDIAVRLRGNALDLPETGTLSLPVANEPPTKKNAPHQDPSPENGGVPEETIVISSAAVHQSSLKRGQTLGRYEIIKPLGKGAMGEVYLAKDETLDRNVAIKTFQFDAKIDSDSIRNIKQNLYKEAQIAAKLSHPNIVTIYDAGEDWDLSYVAMELIEGIELAEYCLPEKLLAFHSIAGIIAKIALALDYAHSHGIIHRDIKPPNIMIQNRKEIKIMDFGMACVYEQNIGDIDIAGTPLYMSPEQLDGKNLDGRTDLYSLGVTLFEMLTGQKPFYSKQLRKLVHAIHTEPTPLLSGINPDIPEHFQPIINKLLEKNKLRRYASGNDLVDDLKQFYSI